MHIPQKKIYRLNPDCDKDRLLEIVKVNNEAFDRGERTPVCIGHTPGQDATTFLTVDVGEGKNFSTDGEFVLCDLEIDDAFEDAVKRHRGLSIELWSDNRVYPISLLAHNRPALELEPIKYSREGEHTTSTLPDPEEDIDMDASAMKNLIAECLLQSDLAAQLKSLTDQVSKVSLQCQTMDEAHQKLQWLFEEEQQEEEQAEGLQPQEGEGVPGEEAAESPAEAVQEDAAAEAEEHPELPPEEVEKIAEDHVAEGKGEEKPKVEQKEDMAMALPSGTNTFTPSTGGTAPPKKKKNYEELELESETYRLASENQKTLAEDYAKQVESVAVEKNSFATKLAEMERKYAMAQRKDELRVLAGKYEFDVEAEMKLVETMDDGQFDQHKKLVIVKYSMPPVNKPAVQVGELAKVGPSEKEIIPAAKMAQVVKYAAEKAKTDKSYSTVQGFNKAWQDLFGTPAP